MDLHLTLTDEELAAIAALLHTSPENLDEQVVCYVLRRLPRKIELRRREIEKERLRRERDVLCSCAVRLAKEGS